MTRAGPGEEDEDNGRCRVSPLSGNYSAASDKDLAVDNSFSDSPFFIGLADTRQIDILLGSTIFWELMEDGKIKIPDSQIVLQNSKLGWIVGGFTKFSGKRANRQQRSVNCTVVTDVPIEEGMKRFWEIEEVNSKRYTSTEEQVCEEIFVKTHKRDSEGRFVVKIPFKKNVSQLGDSRHLALQRFKSLEKRLSKDPDLYAEYSKIMKEYISMGHMKKVQEKNDHEKISYYIPHHAVRKESLTTKLRVVFDASMPTTSGLSLNDIQYIGPTIQNDLFELLINFRLYKYVMTGDISKMYRMVWLHNDHKPFHRIFWRFNMEDPIQCYELQTVTFGTASAPFLAIRCLYQLAVEANTMYPHTSRIIKNNFYVDDLLYGAETLEELLRIQHEITSILASAGFCLRKWLCNDARVYERLNVDRDLECNTLQFGGKEHKMLGIAWDTESDEIVYSHHRPEDRAITKRSVVSELFKIFDPLGLLGPVLVAGKLFIQRLWQEQSAWDEPVPSELTQVWIEFRQELDDIGLIRSQRKVLVDGHKGFELHGFCDASQRAYGACIFVRSQDGRGEVHSRLLCSKSRVAPLKTISLPKLELSAALLLARLINKIVKKMEFQPSAIHYWSDSTITLCWIQGNPSRWKTFVANRVGEIQQTTNIRNWHHVSSEDNPADILSRGATVRQLAQSEIWWSGPSWLGNKVIKYEMNVVQETVEVPEERAHVYSVIVPEITLFERFSSLDRLIRITARCIRFKENCKVAVGQRKLGDLGVEELAMAKITLLRLMQQQAFPDEYRNLRLSKTVGKRSRLLALNPFMDCNQLIRVGGRLEKSQLDFDAKHPVILASGHLLTKLIARQAHEESFHCGPTALLSFIRQKYWPLDGRNLAKGVVRGCRVCFLAKPATTQYLMGQLPSCRTMRSFPFQNVGVDYAGPILLKDRKTRGYKVIKAYVCLFVCMATKAIHLECVSDLSTEAFVLCLKRFVSRRGKPAHVFSDNAKNFVGANTEIRRVYKYIADNFEQINKYIASQGITWHFIPPRSPSFGGIWEAGIKSTKMHLSRVMRGIKFDFEQFHTILCQIEGVLNSRPLTSLSSDPEDLIPLTPGHFLIGRAINQHPEISNPSSFPTSRLKQYRQLEMILDHFWRRWSKEYVHELQVRSKWKKSSDPSSVRVGQVVLVKEDTPPLQWPLGVIVEVHPGADGAIRVVSVKVRGHVTKRGLNRICILPEAE